VKNILYISASLQSSLSHDPSDPSMFIISTVVLLYICVETIQKFRRRAFIIKENSFVTL